MSKIFILEEDGVKNLQSIKFESEKEIEEWICISQGYSINDRPRKVLERELKYKKRQLPSLS